MVDLLSIFAECGILVMGCVGDRKRVLWVCGPVDLFSGWDEEERNIRMYVASLTEGTHFDGV